MRAAVDTAEKAEREAAQARSAAALAAQQAAAERERREQAETRAGREVAATEDRLHREQRRAQDALAGQARAEADRDALRDQLAAARQDRDTADAASRDAEDRLAALTERAGNTAD